MSLADTFLRWAPVASRQAGHVARQFQGKVENLGKSAHGTPESEALTAVDLACQEVFLELLCKELPEVAIDAEEDTRLSAQAPPESPDRPLLVLDPLDGTLSYLSGSDDWAVMSALVEGGRFAASYLEFPALDRSVWATAGGGCWYREGAKAPIRVRGFGELPTRLLCGAWFPSPGCDALSALGFEVVSSRCSAVDATAPILGRGMGSVSRYRIDRRHAIGLFASLVAGASVSFGAYRWQGEDPTTLSDGARPTVLAAREEDVLRIRDALADRA